MIERRLYGDDAIVSRVMEKIELAARRAVNDAVGSALPDEYIRTMEKFAEELNKIQMDLGR